MDRIDTTTTSRVSVIVPTFREAGNLPELIQRLEKVRQERVPALSVVIVDDNSRDGTAELIASLGKPWIRLITRTNERGLSSAVVRGLQEATGDVLVVMDADLSHPPEVIPDLIGRLDRGADFVIGSRYVAGGTTDASWGIFRWLNSKVATLLARPFTSARDPMAGFFAIRRETYIHAAALNPIGYKIGLELLVKCGCRNVQEVPIHFVDRTKGESKLNLREQLRYLRHLGRLFAFRYGQWLHLLALMIAMTAFLVPTTAFLPQQCIYVDETTQLSGLTLGPVQVMHWLAGERAGRFGVPPDRMPPVSYWVGSVWSGVFGNDETSMRWFGVLCIGLALILVFEAARQMWGLGAGLAAGLLFGLSPNAIVTAVEIRAYPLFVLFAAGGFFCLMRIVSPTANHRWRWILCMALLSLIAAYTHFFGLLLAGALFLSALLVSLFRRANVAPIALAGSAVMAAAWGLQPFVAAAFEKSGGNSTPEAPDLKQFVRYIYRGLFGHPALSVSTAMVLLAVTGAVIAGSIAMWPRRRSASSGYAVFIALVAGMGVAALASFRFSAFDGMQPSYNLWRLPGLALLLGSAVAASSRALRTMAIIGCGLLIVSEGFAASQLMLHGTYFAHGPHRQLAALIEELGAANVAVVHDGPAAWGNVYFPIRYEFNGEVRQFSASQAPGEVRQLPVGDEHVDLSGMPAKYLVVVQAREQSWSDVAQQIHHGNRMLDPGPIAAQLEHSSNWRLLGHETIVATLAADVRIYQMQ